MNFAKSLLAAFILLGAVALPGCGKKCDKRSEKCRTKKHEKKHTAGKAHHSKKKCAKCHCSPCDCK